MMQGLDASADVVFMVGYHGSISGESSVLSHTYNPSVVSHVALNGVGVGESGINALVALARGVPVGLVTGDRQTAAEADPFLAGAERVVVKESFTRFGAVNQHPSVEESAVVASPDKDRGDVVKALVVLKAGIQPGDALIDDIKAFVRTKLSKHEYPREIEFIDALPKTPDGKIKRKELKERERRIKGAQS